MSESSISERFHGDLPRRSAGEAATHVPASGTMLVSGFGSVGYPKAVPLALAESDRGLSLTVVSGGTVGEEIDSAMVEADAIDRRFPYQGTPEAREAVNRGEIAYHDRHIAGFGDEIRFGLLAGTDVAVVEAIAVGEDWLIPSTSIGHTPAAVEAADRLIVEVNREQPLALQSFHDVYRQAAPPNRQPIPLTEPGGRIGDSRIRFDPDQLAAVVETERRDSPYSFRTPTDADQGVARNFGAFMTDEIERNPALVDAVHLQFGVGSLGNALMGELDEIDFGDRTVAYYGEVIQDGLLDLLGAGELACASATSLALSESGQNRLFADVDRYADDVVLRPADVSNSAELITRFGVVAINSALEVDLYGHANSTHANGTHAVNGIGGSGDFNRHGLVSITALPSTASDGDISRIVPMVTHGDHSEHDIDVIVTEQGVADLRGCSPRERATALVDNCAHPSFRPALRSYLDRAEQQGGHMPHDLDTVFDR